MASDASHPIDIAVVGAGAAGLMTAIAARQEAARLSINPSVVLFDSREKIGAKILISGGTRCNVTHRVVRATDYEGGARHFIQHVLEAFTPEQTIEFFKTLGVDLVLEPSGKYFPSTHSGKTVLEAFLKRLKETDVALCSGSRISAVKKNGDEFFLTATTKANENPLVLSAKRVVLTTGGLSYPETGSDGTGFLIAKNFGHTLVKTTPALTPLTSTDAEWAELSGVTVDVELSYYERQKKKKTCSGSFLFTHFGFSGPAALDLSRHFARAESSCSPAIFANFIPGLSLESFEKFFTESKQKAPLKQIKKVMLDCCKLPERVMDVLLKKINAPAQTAVRQISSIQARKIYEGLRSYPLPVSGVVGYKKAEATAGGIDLKEVHVATMESRIVPGLYFAGEMLDADGRIGGFNFQWAWSSGTVAGKSAARSVA